MSARLNALMIVRRATERRARLDLIAAAGDAQRQADVARRLDDAMAGIALLDGLALGGLLAAKGELTGRIQNARGFAIERADAAAEQLSDAARARHEAKRAVLMLEERCADAKRTREAKRALTMPPLRIST